MVKNLFLWIIALGISYLNIRLVSLRWSESIIPFQLPDKFPEYILLALRAFAAGIVSYAFILSLWEQIRSRRWVYAALALIAGGVVVYLMKNWIGVEGPYTLQSKSVWWIAGFVGAFLCLAPFKERQTTPPTFTVAQLPWFFFVTFNILMLLIPMSTLSPGFEQTPNEYISPSDITFGSIHSDLTPAYRYGRVLINSMFPLPSINATSILSAFHVALAVALTACAVSVIFGSAWGWLLVLVALTEKWVVASGVASSIVGMPLVSSSLILLLGVWALYRPATTLGKKEALSIGLVGALGTIYTLFGYAAGRMPWVFGGMVVAVILLYRGAFKLNGRALTSLFILLAPTLLSLGAVVHFIFDDNTQHFKSKIVISPPKELIADPDTYPEPVTKFRNPDTVIWWGTARVNSRNMTIHWLRSPSELWVEAKWMAENIVEQPPIDRAFFILGLTGLVLGALSSSAYRRKGVILIGVMTLCAATPFLLGEDYTAYRRGAFISIGFSALLVGLFAYLSRPRISSLATLLCASFCIIRLPLEIPTLTTHWMYAPICSMCQHQIPIRTLANDPLFESVADRTIIFPVAANKNTQAVRCQTLIIDTYEFKKLAPKSSQTVVASNNLAEPLTTAQIGDILAVRCDPEDVASQPLCTNAIQGAKFLGTVPRHIEGQPLWWAIHEKQG